MKRPHKVSSKAIVIDVNVIPPQVEAVSTTAAAAMDDLLHHDRQTMPSDLTSYLGLSFAVFLGLLPGSYQSHLSSLHHRNRALAVKLLRAEEQLCLMKSRRQEDSKANARVVEIFASHRQAWQAEEKRLLQQLDAAAEEARRLRVRAAELEKSGAELRAVVERLQREVEEREQVINFLSKRQDAREEEMEKEVCISHNRAGSVVEEAGDQMYCGSGYGRVGKIRASEGLDACFSGRCVDADQMEAILRYQTALLGRDDFFASSRSVGWQVLFFACILLM